MGRFKDKLKGLTQGMDNYGNSLQHHDGNSVKRSTAPFPYGNEHALTFDYGERPRVLNRGNKHVACVLLLDTSGTMEGESIEQLKKALVTFRDSQLKDPLSNGCIDVCVVTFDDDANVLVPFCPLRDFVVPDLKPGGLTNLEAGIRIAYAQIKMQQKIYGENGIDAAVPWILLLTDGMPNKGDTNGVIQFVKEKEGHQPKPRFYLYGVGTGNYDRDFLMRLCAPNRAWEATATSFSGLFDWVSQSLSQISQSSAGTSVITQPLPQGVLILPNQ